uniref:Uncharacterized protein AlNc14C68G4761 n=1 Tax=Albugo laibachii Nc14 TaxID=890382 RepID=F0WDP1_9STRA|nr:conserved hypothetical protein [Albugo laibachii Nc14]|eukprot:CCA19317.1 conserved hypothetical protein [Albugo laibachii Nc14]
MESIDFQLHARTFPDPASTLTCNRSKSNMLIKTYPVDLNRPVVSTPSALLEECDILRELLFDSETSLPHQFKPLIKLQSYIGTSNRASMAHHISVEKAHTFQYGDEMPKLRTPFHYDSIVPSNSSIDEVERNRQSSYSYLLDDSSQASNDQCAVLSAAASMHAVESKFCSLCACSTEIHAPTHRSATDSGLTKPSSSCNSNRGPFLIPGSVSEPPHIDNDSISNEFTYTMTALVSPPKVFIQEFCRHPTSFFQEMNDLFLDRNAQHISSFEDTRSESSSFSSCSTDNGTKTADDSTFIPYSTHMSDFISDRVFQGRDKDNVPAQTESRHKSSRPNETHEQKPSVDNINGPIHEKKLHVYCSHSGCTNLRRSGGFCNRHGGKCCEFSGCHRVALSRSKCPDHGGGSRCKKDGCYKFAQTRGLCKSHGGGRQCNVAGCFKNAHQNRLCRSHGGGKRCKYLNCSKWAG